MAFTYELPVQGATAPTPAQAARVSQVAGIYTGTVETAEFTITHNLEISSTDLANGLPEVEFEALHVDFYTEDPVVLSKTATTVVIGVTGASANQFLRVRIQRPNTLVR